MVGDKGAAEDVTTEVVRAGGLAAVSVSDSVGCTLAMSTIGAAADAGSVTCCDCAIFTLKGLPGKCLLSYWTVSTYAPARWSGLIQHVGVIVPAEH